MIHKMKFLCNRFKTFNDTCFRQIIFFSKSTKVALFSSLRKRNRYTCIESNNNTISNNIRFSIPSVSPFVEKKINSFSPVEIPLDPFSVNKENPVNSPSEYQPKLPFPRCNNNKKQTWRSLQRSLPSSRTWSTLIRPTLVLSSFRRNKTKPPFPLIAS